MLLNPASPKCCHCCSVSVASISGSAASSSCSRCSRSPLPSSSVGSRSCCAPPSSVDCRVLRFHRVHDGQVVRAVGQGLPHRRPQRLILGGVVHTEQGRLGDKLWPVDQPP